MPLDHGAHDFELLRPGFDPEAGSERCRRFGQPGKFLIINRVKRPISWVSRSQ